MSLGSILRKKRKEHKLTLKAVSEKAGISEGFLSQVENDVNAPSVYTLMSICRAINVEPGDVLKQAEDQKKLVIIKKSEWEDADFPASGFVTRRFFPPENRRIIDSSVIAIEPGKSIPVRKDIKNSQEVFCVLKGTIELVYGDEILSLQEGDSVHYFSLSVPEKQKISNKSKKLAVVMWVGTI